MERGQNTEHVRTQKHFFFHYENIVDVNNVDSNSPMTFQRMNNEIGKKNFNNKTFDFVRYMRK